MHHGNNLSSFYMHIHPHVYIQLMFMLPFPANIAILDLPSTCVVENEIVCLLEFPSLCNWLMLTKIIDL
jgi:hypothetical protein